VASGLSIDSFTATQGIKLTNVSSETDQMDQWKITLNERPRDGLFSEYFRLTLLDANGKKLNSSRVSVIGKATTRFTATPDVLPCGLIEHGAPHEVKFAVCGVGYEKFRIHNIEPLDRRVIRITKWHLMKRNQTERGEVVQVSFEPLREGLVEGGFRVSLSAIGDSEVFVVPVKLSCLVNAPRGN
jgi:hypothetical protein